jgi:hypothetical protein
MSGHAGAGPHYHGTGTGRYEHSHIFLHINHEHDGRQHVFERGVKNRHPVLRCTACNLIWWPNESHPTGSCLPKAPR